MNAKLIFIEKNKTFFFEKPNNLKPKTKKKIIFKLYQFSIFFCDNLGIGPWVSRIN